MFSSTSGSVCRWFGLLRMRREVVSRLEGSRNILEGCYLVVGVEGMVLGLGCREQLGMVVCIGGGGVEAQDEFSGMGSVGSGWVDFVRWFATMVVVHRMPDGVPKFTKQRPPFFHHYEVFLLQRLSASALFLFSPVLS